ncbi:C40 family peptidase [Pendulispora brunnea]|uniref:C40 family peptidase n=1 Tax=Pendulispora brunnea TaxID=2905690 RepID=A0ABZ2K0K5_9BACT
MRMLHLVLVLVLVGVFTGGCARSVHRRLPRDARNIDTAPSRGPEARSMQVGQVLSFAESQIGKPYCWGGEGPRCFDCSGLAQMAYSRAGLRIPRTSHDMAERLPEIPMEEAQAGDILWWPGHVAIYEGEGWVIDAFNSREGVVRRYGFTDPPHRAFRPY